MKELEYPFDASWILSNRRKIRRSLLAGNRNYIEKKVAVLGGSTTANIIQILDLFLMNQGIKATFYESEYGMYYEDAVFGNQELSAFHPDIIYIHTTNRNVPEVPAVSDSIETIDVLLESYMKRFRTIWEKLSENYACPIIQNNFEMPLFRLLGNRDAWDKHGTVNFSLSVI